MLELLAPTTRVESISVRSPVSDFINRLWNHSLLTEETRQHRAKAKEEFARFIQFISEFPGQPNLNTVVAGRIMGDVWRGGPGSDHDVIVYCEDQNQASKFFQLTNGDARYGNRLRVEFNIDVAGIQTLSHQERTNSLFEEEMAVSLSVTPDELILGNAFLFEKGMAVPLLVTPDELILGNVSLAHKARLDIIEQLEQMNEAERTYYWNVVFKGYFREFYRDWFYHRDKHYKSRGSDPKRNSKQAFEELIIEHASRSSDPNGAIESFFNSLYQLELPDFAAYSEEIISNGGELCLNWRR